MVRKSNSTWDDPLLNPVRGWRQMSPPPSFVASGAMDFVCPSPPRPFPRVVLGPKRFEIDRWRSGCPAPILDAIAHTKTLKLPHCDQKFGLSKTVYFFACFNQFLLHLSLGKLQLSGTGKSVPQIRRLGFSLQRNGDTQKVRSPVWHIVFKEVFTAYTIVVCRLSVLGNETLSSHEGWLFSTGACWRVSWTTKFGTVRMEGTKQASTKACATWQPTKRCVSLVFKITSNFRSPSCARNIPRTSEKK